MSARDLTTDELLTELNIRMDDRKVVDAVIDMAVKAGTRYAKARDARTGRSPAPSVRKAIQPTLDALSEATRLDGAS